VKQSRAHDVSVFINCPFDPPYKPITFAVYDCGFFPRAALEEDNAGEVRYHKIFAARFELFEAELPEWCRRQQLVSRELTFTDQGRLIEEWLYEHPWSGASTAG
jgi:hypothetical protein